MKYETFPIPPPAAVYGEIADGGFAWSDDVTILRGYLGGLGLANDGTSPGTVIDVGAGVCASDDVTGYMSLAAFSKTTGPWAAGPGNGGLDSGSVANNTWYHVFVIQRTDTGAVDVLISASATSPAMPPPYGRKRRIGAFRTDGAAHILAFVQLGDMFLWATPIDNDINISNLGTTVQTFTMSGVPTGLSVIALMTFFSGNSGGGSSAVYVYPGILGTLSVSGSRSISQQLGSADNRGGGQLQVMTNTGAQIKAVSGDNTFLYSLQTSTYGWIDTRGRFS